MAKDQIGNNLAKGDHVIVILTNPSVFATVVEIDATEIISGTGQANKQAKIVLAFNITLNGPLAQAIGVFKTQVPPHMQKGSDAS
jgi:hypothetical protein